MADEHDHVEIRTRFDGAWVGGYKVVRRSAPGEGSAVRYTVQRRSDGRVLPERFGADEVRPDQGRGRRSARP
jgi:hypothetical protein